MAQPNDKYKNNGIDGNVTQQSEAITNSANATPTPIVNTTEADTITRQGTASTQLGTSTSSAMGTSNATTRIQDDPGAETEAQRRADQYAQMQGWEKDSRGQWQNKTLFAALRIDQDKLKAERERQERIAKQKQLEAAVYNSGALISDMIAAGIGGNVWKRDKDTTASDAAKDIARLHEEQAKDDKAIKEKENEERQKFLDNYWKTLDDYRNKHIIQVSDSTHTQNQTNNSASVTRQNSTSASTITDRGMQNLLVQAAAKAAMKGKKGGGSDKTQTLRINYHDGKKGQVTAEVPMSDNDFTALKGSLTEAIADIINSGNQNIIKVLKAQGVIVEKTTTQKVGGKERTKIDYTVNDKGLRNLLDTGSAYQIGDTFLPNVMNAYIDVFAGPKKENGTTYTRREIYEMITGEQLDNGKIDELRRKGVNLEAITTTSDDWFGPVTQPQDSIPTK